MEKESLKQKTAGALIWNLFDRSGQQIIVFVLGVITANILSVEDYALLGMLTIFTAIGTILLDSGFSSALIRKQDATETDYNSVFYFNVGVSLAIYLALFFGAPLIADFYNQPILTGLSRVVFLALPINSLSLIQTTLLNKQVRFNVLAKCNVAAITLASTVTLFMALAGCGVWTLAWQPVILAFTRSAILWMSNKWRPALCFNKGSIREMFGFASSLLVSTLMSTIVMNIYSVILGKLFPTRQLGLYTQGNKFSIIVVSAVYSSLQTATYPIFSSIQDDTKRSLRSYRKSMRFTSFLAMPLMLGLVSIAQPFIRLILKQEWWDCVPFFQLTSLLGIFTILISINQNFAKARGRSDLILKLEIIRTVLIFIALVATLHTSALTLIAWQVVAQGLFYLTTTVIIGKAVGYHWFKQMKDIGPYVILGTAMWALLLVPDYFIHSNLLLLIIKIVMGAAFYYLANYILGSAILKEALQMLKHKSA